MSRVIEDITEFDAIYRAEGQMYVKFRKFFLRREEKKLNATLRENTYLPLRILLLESTKRRAKHKLIDLWTNMNNRRMNAPTILSLSTDDIVPIPWQKVCSAMNAPGPISALHFAAYSTDKFAYSTLDGSIHFGSIVDMQLRPSTTISMPNVGFLKFQWVSDTIIIGFGVDQAAYVLIGESRIIEIPLPSPPSEVVKYPGSSALAIIGSQKGVLMTCDLSEIAAPSGATHRQDGNIVISKGDLEPVKFHNAKKSISALSASSDLIICGTSDGDIDMITPEPRVIKKRGRSITEIKAKAVVRISASKFTKSVKNVSVDSLSLLRVGDVDYILLNMRSEDAALLQLADKRLQVAESIRAPSVRAKCPCAINMHGDSYMWICGSDMGDLIVGEQGQDSMILTMHEDAIVSVEWVKGSHMFIAADVSGLISFWRKAE